ncbi:MAG: hypothetical protein EAX90_03125 [Candidatus Heimdallarchaeota archaeon]|nr:hypothetical protein [Candidatus Heimdallarchaeota archaeon]
MKKSLPTLIMVLTITLSSFLMVNSANYTLSTPNFSNELLFQSGTNIIDDLQEFTPDFIETPYEPYINPEVARTGPQDFCTILVHFSDHAVPRWTKAEHEGIMQTIDDYWVNATYGQMSINWEVQGWYDLGSNLADYGYIGGNSS